MRVLHCIPGMGGGGAERQLAYLAGPMRARGWDVHVALRAGGPNLARLEAGQTRIHWLGGAGNHDPALALHLASTMRRVRPDIVQVYFVQMDLMGGAAAELLRIPWVMSERSSAQAYPPTVKNRLRAVIGRTADGIIANSAAGLDYWRGRAPSSVQRFLIPNAVPIDEIDGISAAVGEALPLVPRDALILFAGRFGPEKNLERMWQALRLVLADHPGAVALLCGDGPLRDDVGRRVHEAALGERVLLPGYVDELWPLLKRADVMVSASLFEGQPNAVLEAMAAGCPLVVSDIPAHRELLDDSSAAWACPTDHRAIARALRQVLSDPAAARQRAIQARTRVEGRSINHTAAAYDAAYRQVLARL